MPRKPRNVQQAHTASAAPMPAQEVMATAAALLRPAVRLLLRSGIDYPALATQLKAVFLEEALAQIEAAGHATTDSALSVLSGVHRKDVRAWRQTGRPAAAPRAIAVGSRVFARWLSDTPYVARGGKPRPLPRTGDAPSFEALVRAETLDVHPFTVLQELVRLRIVELEVRRGREFVVPAGDYVPPAGSSEALQLLAANVGDHANAAVANLLGEVQSLEQSVFAAGVTAASAERLHVLARKLWTHARAEMIQEATRLWEADQGSAEARTRVRFGSYFRAAPWEPEPTAQDGKQEGES
jgi:hypothetical protein